VFEIEFLFFSSTSAYRKDQIDQDKRKLRVLKEMYLEDGEFHQEKDFRKKQFRWKNYNGMLNGYFCR
jgi:hypothetical protein